MKYYLNNASSAWKKELQDKRTKQNKGPEEVKDCSSETFLAAGDAERRLRVVIRDWNACYSNFFRWYFTVELQLDALQNTSDVLWWYERLCCTALSSTRR